jgi:hypothetical protein
VSPLLQTRSGHRGYSGSHASKLDEGLEHSVQSQKRRCLDKVGDITRSGVHDRANDSSFGQAPAQSIQMAAKILKQLDTIIPSQKEGTLATRQKHVDILDVEDPISQKTEVSAQGSLLKPSSSRVKESLPNNSNCAAKFTSAAKDSNTVDATSDKSAKLMPKVMFGWHLFPPRVHNILSTYWHFLYCRIGWRWITVGEVQSCHSTKEMIKLRESNHQSQRIMIWVLE